LDAGAVVVLQIILDLRFSLGAECGFVERSQHSLGVVGNDLIK
jgi:hypothetical protein